MTDQFYRPRSHVLIITPDDRRSFWLRMFERTVFAIIVLLIIAGSGIAETQRIKVMEDTSPEVTMQQMGITQ